MKNVMEQGKRRLYALYPHKLYIHARLRWGRVGGGGLAGWRGG